MCHSSFATPGVYVWLIRTFTPAPGCNYIFWLYASLRNHIYSREEDQNTLSCQIVLKNFSGISKKQGSYLHPVTGSRIFPGTRQSENPAFLSTAKERSIMR